MEGNKSIDENMDEFTKLVTDLENLDIVIDEEDQAIILLNSLPRQFEQLKDTLKYGKETLSLDEVISAAYSKELDLKASGKTSKSNGEGLNVRGRSEKKENQGRSHSKSRSKSRTKKTCWTCHKEGHIKRFCPQRKKNNAKADDNSTGDAASVSEEYDNADVLTVSRTDPRDEWILDSGCTFHMTPRKDWLFDFKETNGGKVLMGNNVSCTVEGIGSIRIKMWDGTVRTMKEVRFIPELKRN